MTDPRERATFAGTTAAQERVIAGLTPDERLLDALVELAQSSGALQRPRSEKPARIDEAWGTGGT